VQYGVFLAVWVILRLQEAIKQSELVSINSCCLKNNQRKVISAFHPHFDVINFRNIFCGSLCFYLQWPDIIILLLKRFHYVVPDRSVRVLKLLENSLEGSELPEVLCWTAGNNNCILHNNERCALCLHVSLGLVKIFIQMRP